MEKKAVIISGSPRKDGNTDFIASLFRDYLQEQGYRCDRIFLRDLKYSSCTGCEKCRKGNICTGLQDDLTPVYRKLLDSQLWVVGTPVHNYNVTAWIKAFIDRLYCFYIFTSSHPRSYTSTLEGKNKKAFLYGIAEQTDEHDFGFTIEAMGRPLEALGLDVMGSYRFYGYFSKILKNDTRRIAEFMKELEEDFRKL